MCEKMEIYSGLKILILEQSKDSDGIFYLKRDALAETKDYGHLYTG